MDRMKSLSEAIRMLMEGEFSGYVKINFSQGSLGRVEKYEEFYDAASHITAEKDSEKKTEVKEFPLRKAVPVILLFLTALAGCSAAGKIETDETSITTDCRHPFGDEVLLCKVTIDNVADAKPIQSGTGV
jgi:hypothetical protein